MQLFSVTNTLAALTGANKNWKIHARKSPEGRDSHVPHATIPPPTKSLNSDIIYLIIYLFKLNDKLSDIPLRYDCVVNNLWRHNIQVVCK